MCEFFDRQPQDVASALVDRALRVGRKNATVRGATPLRADSIGSSAFTCSTFGTAPGDVYVAPDHGSYRLFIRTGARTTCVCIDEVEIEDMVLSGPGLACRALGITRVQTGRASFDGRRVRIRWQ